MTTATLVMITEDKYRGKRIVRMKLLSTITITGVIMILGLQ